LINSDECNIRNKLEMDIIRSLLNYKAQEIRKELEGKETKFKK